MREVVDTNVILRFLVGDQPEQQKQAESWFREAERGERELIVATVVVAEASFVLESFYKKSRSEIARAMEVFLGQRWLRVSEREVLMQVWSEYKKGIHFVDAYLWAWAQVNKVGIVTFDEQLKKKLDLL